MTDEDPTKIDMYGKDNHIRGTTAHGNIEFDCPLVSFIDTNLWQGGCFHGTALNPIFKHIISLYPWERYKLTRARMDTEMYVSMYDSTDQGMEQVDSIAALINSCRKTGPTLVHCQAGLNRSSLVVARALFLDGAFDTGDEIVDYLRSARSPAVLCNPAFEAEVRSWKHNKIWLSVGLGDNIRMLTRGKPHVYKSLDAAQRYSSDFYGDDSRLLELDFADRAVTGRYV
jgi:protein-tyrosine phosphatase